MGRHNDEAAAAIVFDVLGADRYPLPVVTWLEGGPCGDRLDVITYRRNCYAGVTFETPIWCVPYVTWPRGRDTITGTAFAHELTHCASLRLGLGMDPQHEGWLWDELPAVQEVLEAEGL